MSLNVRGLTDLASWAPVDVPKRKLSPEEIRDALARRRRGQGWQTIANIHGLNVIDLRRACGDPDLPPEFQPEAAPAPARKLRSRPGDRSLGSVLEALEAGARTGAEICAATQLGVNAIYELIAIAQRKGLAAGEGRQRTLRLTDAGRAWLEARRG
jgi:hypothetical protein